MYWIRRRCARDMIVWDWNSQAITVSRINAKFYNLCQHSRCLWKYGNLVTTVSSMEEYWNRQQWDLSKCRWQAWDRFRSHCHILCFRAFMMLPVWRRLWKVMRRGSRSYTAACEIQARPHSYCKHRHCTGSIALSHIWSRIWGDLSTGFTEIMLGKVSYEEHKVLSAWHHIKRTY